MHRSIVSPLLLCCWVMSLLLGTTLGKAIPTPTSTPAFKQLFEFNDTTFIENVHVRPNGHLLLSTFGTAPGELFTLDPSAKIPTLGKVANLTGSTGLSGMASIGTNLFAISGGVHSLFEFANNSMSVYVVSLPDDADEGCIIDIIPVPGTEMLNGMAALPATPHVVLCADSIGGRIFRIDTQSRKVDVAFSDASIGPGDNDEVPLGANGLKILNGYLYFTNSGQGTFARIKINNDGSKAGEADVIARLEGAATISNAYDDFTFDDEGNAYVAVHSFSFVKITPGGVQSTFLGGDGNNTKFKEPTSAALSLDGKTIYAVTGGTILGDEVFGGQVFQVDI